MLTISGTGDMYDYADGSQTPWAAYRDSIRVIQLPSMLNSIGAHAFEGCAVTSLSFTGIVNRIGTCAFRNCTSLSALSISGIVNSIEAEAFSGCASLWSVAVSGIVNAVDPTAFPGGVFPGR
ncbi:MAG: leucine-rich repeat domain-containing protein [Ruminococcaceae bacterium]|nr:leucine-rich repeat domain-containing protein [Oscillospiraceae bacterium]